MSPRSCCRTGASIARLAYPAPCRGYFAGRVFLLRSAVGRAAADEQNGAAAAARPAPPKVANLSKFRTLLPSSAAVTFDGRPVVSTVLLSDLLSPDKVIVPLSAQDKGGVLAELTRLVARGGGVTMPFWRR